jgi:hypothetical protein
MRNKIKLAMLAIVTVLIVDAGLSKIVNANQWGGQFGGNTGYRGFFGGTLVGSAISALSGFDVDVGSDQMTVCNGACSYYYGESDIKMTLEGAIQTTKTYGISRMSGPYNDFGYVINDDGFKLVIGGYESQDGTTNNRLVITSRGNLGKDHGADTLASNPTVMIYSSTDPDSDNTQHVDFYHDTRNAVISSGKGIVWINSALEVSGTLSHVGEAKFSGVSGDGTGKAVCIKADGNLGTCSDAVGAGGTCTCA